jgi:hypothetical protein
MHRDTTIMTIIRRTFITLLAASAFAALAATPPAATQRTFSSPEEAARALADAVRAEDATKLLAVVGPKSRQWIWSGDKVSDRADWKRFLEAYDQKNAVVAQGDGKAVLHVGNDDWPFPAPLVKRGATWVFDAQAGREEVINRRVGRNELSTIQALLAIVDAQREYAAGADGAYAKVFRSGKGRKDGLYWPAAAGEKQSPLGPIAATAAREGYGGAAASGKPQPFHGYLYRMLTGQARSAAGGAYDYVVKGRMIGGFAVVAYPASYGLSGVKTFIVNHDGVVYEKDLGPGGADIAGKMTRFDPGKGWEKLP